MTHQLAVPRVVPSVRRPGPLVLARFLARRTIGWRVAPVALLWSLFVAFAYRGRPWAGDWVWAMTNDTAAVAFTATALACVAAYDAGTVICTEQGAAWDSVPRRLSDVCGMWAAALAPFVLVTALTTGAVAAALIRDGAAYGQTVAPLAQQLILLGFGSALGVLCGTFLGPRVGSLTALVLGGYLIYWQGYVQRSTVPPTRGISATAPLIGVKLNESLVSIQGAQAALWVAAALGVAAYSRSTRGGRRRPTAVTTVLAAMLVVGSATAAVSASSGRPDPVPVAMPRVCRTAGASTVCLYQGHQAGIDKVLADVNTVRANAADAGVGDLIPSHITETRVLTNPAAGQLGYDGVGGRPTSPRSTLSSLLPAPGGCPAYVALVALPAGSPEAAFPQAESDAERTMVQLLQAVPTSRWVMSSARLRRYVTAVGRCDIAAAVRAT